MMLWYQVFLCCIVTMCAGCIGPFSEMIESKYADRIAANPDILRGWIPNILPADAADIVVVYDIDINYAWGCFKTKDFTSVRNKLSELKAIQISGPIDDGPSEIFRDFSWWPASMRSSSIEAMQVKEFPKAPSPGFGMRIGLDSPSDLVCYHRKYGAS
jgi:hypothetical protein